MLQNFFRTLFGKAPALKIHRDYSSPNFTLRRGAYADQNPSMIVLHYTGMDTAQAAIDRLCDKAAQVSAHYVVREDGKIYQLVDDDKRAWHAGRSYWGGVTGDKNDINSASIGIEIVNPGHQLGYCDYTDKQMAAVRALCCDLIKTYDIAAANIVGHSDIAPGRKIDPGEKFPWRWLADHGIGLWPHPQEMDYQAAQDLILNPESIKEVLTSVGYDPEATFENVVEEFHRHYYPEKFAEGGNAKDIDVASVARLLSLIRQKHENLA